MAVAWSRVWDWYLAQARAALPASTLAWLQDRGERRIIIRSQSGSVEITGLDEDFNTKVAEGGTARDILTQFANLKQSVKVILELPRDKFFVRTLETPLAARTSLAQSLPKEIERKTLFKLNEIYFGHVIAKSPEHPDRLRVTQWILRRDIVQKIIEQAGLSLAQLDLVRPEAGSDGENELPQILLEHGAQTSNWFRRTLIAMCGLGLLFIAIGLGVRAWRVDQIGAQLDEEIAVAAQRAGAVQLMANQAIAEGALLSGLRRYRENTPALADLIEETARILPDSAYLTEWRLSEPRAGERAVDLVGLATSAADLPALFDKSPMFSNATLTAAIMPDLQEKRERFSMQLRVRTKKGASRR
jgi:general secretion pathway protein L